MFHTIGHRTGGFVQVSNIPGCREVITAQRAYRTLGEYATVAAAKAALTRDHKKEMAQRNAEHRKAIDAIWQK